MQVVVQTEGTPCCAVVVKTLPMRHASLEGVARPPGLSILHPSHVLAVRNWLCLLLVCTCPRQCTVAEAHLGLACCLIGVVTKE